MIEARVRGRLRPDFSMDFDLRASGGVSVLFGPEGSGRTALLDSLAGLLDPEDGRILINGQIVYDREAGINLPARMRRCGYVLPRPSLVPHMTLRSNLLFAASCRRLPRLERHRRVNELLERFRLTEVSGLLPATAAGSDQQRCAFARALVTQPVVLLVDEPGAGARTPLRLELIQLLRELRAGCGVQILFATRDLDECFEIGDEVFVVLSGRIAQSGTPREIYSQPASPEVARLLGCYNLLPASIEALDPGRNTSRLRLPASDLTGPYFPGRFRGDSITLCVRYDELRAIPASAKPGPGQMAANLVRVSETRGSIRLHFSGDILVDMPRSEFEEKKLTRDWLIDFPAECLRALPASPAPAA
jgi:ABC-type sulfate/molybdate transport systems ATPase subunit